MPIKLRLPQVSDIKNQRVLVRVDYNVPLSGKSSSPHVSDDRRIQASLKTLRFLIEHQAKVILVTHLGRPDGRPNPDFSLAPIAKHLEKLLDQPIHFIADPLTTPAASEQLAQLQPGQVAMLENIRFYDQEETNDRTFAKHLAELADVYINEAFSAAHRAHASTEGVTHHVPSFAGFAFAEEVSALSKVMSEPKRPFVMVVGGAKISDKVSAIVNLTQIADIVLLGGGIANNFLKAEGFDIAASYVQDTPADLKKKGIDYTEVAEELIDDTKQERLLVDGYMPLPKILYPIDVLAAPSLESGSAEEIELTSSAHQQAIAKNLKYLDIGPKTIKLYKDLIAQAGTIFWNGPMGVFENPVFAKGTREIAQAIAESKGTSVLGGGDTIAAIDAFKLEGKFDYVSAAGGASLEFLAGAVLPGVKPLQEKETN